jgi:hypothetical protein
MVYPGLVDLLARTNRTPLLSGVLNVQMARLAVASVSDMAKTDDGEGEIRYIDMVSETLCSSYASIVSRMKCLSAIPIEEKKGMVSTSSSASKIGRSIVSGMSPISGVGVKRAPGSAGSRAESVSGYSVVVGLEERNKLSEKNGTFHMLQGLTTGLNVMAVALAAKGDNIRVRELQKRIMDCCIELVSNIFSNHAASPTDISYRIMAIGLLLQPISSSFVPASEGKDLGKEGENISIADYRSLWMSFVLFRLKVIRLCIKFLDLSCLFGYALIETSLCVLRTHIESRFCNPPVVMLLI